MRDTDWAVVRKAAQELEAYLLAKDLYWVLLEGRLSPGTLLLSIVRLKAAEPYSAELSTIVAKVERVRSEWRSAWLQKVAREMPERIRLWANYVHDLSSEAPSQGEYAAQVRIRAMLCLLAEEQAMTVGDELALTVLDERVQMLTMPGEFVWGTEFASGFEPQTYWFLYRKVGKASVIGGVA